MDQDTSASLLQGLLAGQEARIDKFLARLNVGNFRGGKEKTVQRLDRVFRIAATGTGAANGVSLASGKIRGGLPTIARRISTMGFASAAALYVVARARLAGIPVSDPRVSEALKNALLMGATVPAAEMALGSLGRMGRASVGLPRDPRTVLVLAAGGALGGWTGEAMGRAVIDTVSESLEGPIIIDDLDFQGPATI